MDPYFHGEALSSCPWHMKVCTGHSAKNVGGETVVNLCTPSGHALYLPSFVKLSKTVSKL